MKREKQQIELHLKMSPYRLQIPDSNPRRCGHQPGFSTESAAVPIKQKSTIVFVFFMVFSKNRWSYRAFIRSNLKSTQNYIRFFFETTGFGFLVDVIGGEHKWHVGLKEG